MLISPQLLRAAQAGDNQALSELLVQLKPDIRRYARRLCHRSSALEDIVQEALIVVYRRVGSVRSPAAFAGWLFKVVSCLCLLPALMLMKGVEELTATDEGDYLAAVPANDLRLDLIFALEFFAGNPPGGGDPQRLRGTDDRRDSPANLADTRGDQEQASTRPCAPPGLSHRRRGKVMIAFGRSDAGIFASACLTAHILRGVAAVLLTVAAVSCQADHPWGSLAAGGAALVALRGCPVCWTIGLFETLAQARAARFHTSPVSRPFGAGSA